MFEIQHFDIQSTAQSSKCVVCLSGVWLRGGWVCEYVEEGGGWEGRGWKKKKQKMKAELRK